jgi:hypothetical protein
MIKVYVNAFDLRVTDAVLAVSDMCSWLIRDQFQELIHSNRQRVMGFGMRDGYLCGILLSTKSHKNYITVKTKNGKTVASVRRTRQGELMADVNYFAINKETGSGVVSSYYGSGGICSFGNILAKLYRKEVERMRDVELEESGELGDDVNSDVDMSQIKKKYRRARLELIPMVPDSTFSEGLKAFAKFSRFEYVEPTVRDPRYKPILPQITKMRRSLTLTMEGTTKSTIRQFLSGFVSNYNVSEGTVYGSDESGKEFTLQINPELYCLSKYPHDDVVIADNIRLDKVAQMPIFTTLLKDVNSHKELFV